MLFRGSVGGNNPTAVASVMANTAHLLCLISRASLRIFNPCVFVLRPADKGSRDQRHGVGQPQLSLDMRYGNNLAYCHGCRPTDYF